MNIGDKVWLVPHFANTICIRCEIVGHTEECGKIVNYILDENGELSPGDNIFLKIEDAIKYMVNLQEDDLNRIKNLTLKMYRELVEQFYLYKGDNVNKIYMHDWFNFADIDRHSPYGITRIINYIESSTREKNKASGIEALALSLGEEAGEVQGVLKKYLYHDHELDINKLIEELGDLLWYVVNICSIFNISIFEIIDNNTTKLSKRYPEGFNPLKSKNRVE